MVAKKDIFWGTHSKSIQYWLEKGQKSQLVKRIWDKDATIWTADADGQKEVSERLGWLDSASKMKAQVSELSGFTEQIKKEGFLFVVLLGMGGSSLAPEVFQSVFGNKSGHPELIILDSTDPESVLAVESRIDLSKTLFIVSSKSGGTVEVMSFFKYFFEKTKTVAGKAVGGQFVAVTDPGTSLEALAKDNGFRKVFLASPDVGGRFSVLTYFGLLPAALVGVNLEKLLDSAIAMTKKSDASRIGEDNAAMSLGVGMAVLSEEKRDKLTLLTSEALASFGDWVEQLVAESTGKEEFGVTPIVREAAGDVEVYGDDRFFVALLLESERNDILERRLQELQRAGHPVLIYRIKEKEELGGEFFRWEMATAIASAFLKINAFDQPDVQSAKDKTKAILAALKKGKAVEDKQSKQSLEAFLEEIKVRDYVAILAFLPNSESVKKSLEAMRREIRNATRSAVTVGLGPRYLHSTGQLHKGGPNKGRFILITSSHGRDAEIPGESYSFEQLELAQAMGDFEALEASGRSVVRIHLDDFSDEKFSALSAKLQAALSAESDVA